MNTFKNFVTRTIATVMVVASIFVSTPAYVQAAPPQVSAKEIFDAVNAQRADAGLPAYKWEEGMAEGTDIRVKESATKFSHTRPDGSAWYTCCELSYAENLACADESYFDIVDAWMNSPAHKANVLDSELKTAYVSTILKGGVLYVAMEYGY